LIQLQSDALSATVNQDYLNYLLAKQQFNRYLILYKKKLLANSDMDKYKVHMEVAKAQMDHDHAMLMKTSVRAPFSGTLGIKLIDVGQYITAGEKLVALEDRSKLYVDFYLPEKYSDSIKVGDLVHLTSNQVKSHTWSGKVIACDSRLDIDTRALLVRALVTSTTKNLIPGMYVHVEVYLNSISTKHMVIPQSSVVYSPDGLFVFVYKNGKVKRQAVKLGKYQQQWIEVISGLESNEQIVTVGQNKLFDGETVNPGGF